MSICDNDIILFHQSCREIINRERASMGIGTLSEKTVHAVLKRFYEPDRSIRKSLSKISLPTSCVTARSLRSRRVVLTSCAVSWTPS